MEFKLSEKFIEKYKNKKPPFGFNGLGELVYMRTYSRIKDNGENEKWWETVQRVVEGTYSMQKKWIEQHSLGWNPWQAQKSAQEMYERMFEMKFLPPGRGLWAMGTPITEERKLYSALNNCFSTETKILTSKGFKEIGSLVGSDVTVLTKNGKWVTAPIKSFGVQPLRKLTIQRQGITKEIYVTADHIWFAKSQSEINHNKGFQEYRTDDLQENYRLQYLFGESPKNFSPQGIQHGICFGDGTYDHLYLVGEKDSELVKWFPNNQQTFDKVKNAIRIAHVPAHYKQLPSIEYDRKYLYGWLMGYFAADGSVDQKGQISILSANKSNLEFFQDICGLCGIGTYSIHLSSTNSNFSDERELWKLTLMPDTLNEDFFLIENHRNNFVKEKVKRNWNVVSVEETSRLEEVYCAIVDDTESFVIEGNILTHNCAFVSTANIKEDLEKPFTFLMDASMLGVGVGFDTKGADQIIVKGPNEKKTVIKFEVPDSREGWVESVGLLINSYFTGGNLLEFDYSKIRPAGEPIKGFGGICAGPNPLIQLHADIRKVLDKNVGEPLSITSIVDIQNMIGRAVVAGNVRRCLPEDYEVDTERGFVALKDIQPGDKVKTNSGYKTVLDSIDSGIQSVYTVTTAQGNQYEMTDKHTVLVYTEGTGFQWKMLKDIDITEDKLVSSKQK